MSSAIFLIVFRDSNNVCKDSKNKRFKRFSAYIVMKVESPKNHKLSENKMKEQIAPLISTAPEQPT